MWACFSFSRNKGSGIYGSGLITSHFLHCDPISFFPSIRYSKYKIDSILMRRSLARRRFLLTRRSWRRRFPREATILFLAFLRGPPRPLRLRVKKKSNEGIRLNLHPSPLQRFPASTFSRFPDSTLSRFSDSTLSRFSAFPLSRFNAFTLFRFNAFPIQRSPELTLSRFPASTLSRFNAFTLSRINAFPFSRFNDLKWSPERPRFGFVAARCPPGCSRF